MSQAQPGATVSRTFPVHNATARANFDSSPAGYLVRNGADTAEVVTITNLATGRYRYQATLPAGWTEGDRWEIRVEGDVGGAPVAGIVDEGILVAALPGEIDDAVETILADEFAAIAASVESQLADEFAAIAASVESQLADEFAGIDDAVETILSDAFTAIPAAVNSVLTTAHGAGPWNVTGGSGGGGTVIITPVTGSVGPGDVTRGSFKAFVGAAGSVTLTISDASGDPVDLSGVDLDFVAGPPRGTNVVELASDADPATVVAGGVAGNEIAVDWPIGTFTAPGILIYALRQRDTGFPWALGTIDVEAIPQPT